ncbi:MAG TPA: hypothetical protein PK402_08660 [Tepidisphaeraceae bacterium]|nr:hypothetical protein [Tepidisphaeraceae bacterium]
MSDETRYIIKLILMASVAGMVLAQALSVPMSELAGVFRQRMLLVRAFVAVYVLVPLATLLVILLVKPARNVEIGLAMLAAAPIAPMMIVRIPRAGGQMAQVVALHFAMTLISLVVTPLILQLMGSILGFKADVDVLQLVALLAPVLLLPVGCGVAIRRLWPRFAARLIGPLAKVSWLLVLAGIIAILAMSYQTLFQTSPRSFIAMGAVVTIALAIGHVLASLVPEERVTLAMITAARHPGVVLMIAAANFSRAQAIPVLIPYLIVLLVITTIYMKWNKVEKLDRRD